MRHGSVLRATCTVGKGGCRQREHPPPLEYIHVLCFVLRMVLRYTSGPSLARALHNPVKVGSAPRGSSRNEHVELAAFTFSCAHVPGVLFGVVSVLHCFLPARPLRQLAQCHVLEARQGRAAECARGVSASCNALGLCFCFYFDGGLRPPRLGSGGRGHGGRPRANLQNSTRPFTMWALAVTTVPSDRPGATPTGFA